MQYNSCLYFGSMSFTNKVVIVTGASSGIGAATAILFTKEEAHVVMVGRNETKLKNVSEQCEKQGKKPFVIKADVSNEDDARRIIKDTVRKFGKIDVLVNNAGIITIGSIMDGKLMEAYDKVMNTNLRSVVHLTALAAPHLVKTKGNIVNVSSVAAQSMPVFPQLISYCTSKAGLDHFSRCAAVELASSGVRVNVVNPGPVTTDIAENSGMLDIFSGIEDPSVLLPPLKRVGESEEIADVILFLASDKARSITGSIYISDNGYLLAPPQIKVTQLK